MTPAAPVKPGSRGKEFWLAVPTGAGGSAEVTLSISGEAVASGTVRVPGLVHAQSFSVTPGQVTQVTVPANTSVATAYGVENKGVQIVADQEVTVHVRRRDSRSSESYLALPVTALGTEYALVSGGASSASYGTQFAVVGTEAGTRVTFTRQGTTSSVTLGAGQAFQFAGASSGGADLTGAFITSDKPVAVFSGSRCTNAAGMAPGTCGLQVEQLTPTRAWGRYFLTLPLAGSRGSDTFRVVASQNGTRIRVNAKEVVLQRGQTYQTSLQSAAVIHASAPVQVAQFAYASPAMTLVTPVAQFLNEYTVTAPTSSSGKSYINVIVRGNMWHQVMVDGKMIPLLRLRYLTWNYYGAQLEVTTGTHRLTSPLPFGVVGYGAGAGAAPGGMSLVPVAAVESMKLTPRYSIGNAGQEVCVTAKVASANGDGVPDIAVGFTALRWPVRARTVFTDAQGQAAWCEQRTQQSLELLKATVNDDMEYGFVAWRMSQSPPVVNAGLDANGWVNSELTLSGSASDPDGTPLTYQWTYTPGEDVPAGAICVFGSPDQLTTSFQCDTAGSFTVTLTANDGTSSVSSSATVTQAYASDVTLCNLPRYTRDTERELCGFTTYFGDDSAIEEAWFTVDGSAPIHVTPDWNGGFVRLPYTFVEGDHVITLSARNANGRVTTKEGQMRVDLTPPVVTVVSPEDQGSVRSPIVDVVTDVADDSPVTGTTQFVHSTTVESGQGRVTHTVDLVNRDWVVVLVQARDAAGNFTEVLVPVYVQPED
ncbi:PKD domain-containing protein [Corallococcus exiguus]|uniref:IgGFc-binding protein n=1 Tax=Corallococcus TaxID=83461 RepID=UPI000EB9E094|nr:MULTISPECIES: IgGFc-binding protein [Corallococcus]NNC19829.1 PKD domain-containing protein [Corallococcus exiguus]RKI02951.1 PKD domain-containing protein [Corallococcus sp. AB030]